MFNVNKMTGINPLKSFRVRRGNIQSFSTVHGFVYFFKIYFGLKMLVDVTNGLSEKSGNSREIRFEKHFVMFCEAFGNI